MPQPGPSIPATGDQPSAWGLCPDWGTWLPPPSLWVQPAAKLSLCPRDTRTGHTQCTPLTLHVPPYTPPVTAQSAAKSWLPPLPGAAAPICFWLLSLLTLIGQGLGLPVLVRPAKARILRMPEYCWLGAMHGARLSPHPPVLAPPPLPTSFGVCWAGQQGLGARGSAPWGGRSSCGQGQAAAAGGGGRRNVSKGRAGGDHPGAPCPHAGGSPGHCVWGGLRLQPCMPAPEGHELRLGPGCTDKGTPWEETCLGWAGTGTPP